jgi:hypothetical protein
MAKATQTDAQAKVNEDKDKGPDASEAAQARGAESGDVDVVKAQEQDAKDKGPDNRSDDERIEDAQKADAEAAKESKKEAEERDKEQAKALDKAADAKGQPKKEEVLPVVEARSGVDKVNKDWTVQSDRPYLDYQPEVGQAFVKAQLPDREVQKAAGIDPDQWAAGVVVLDDDDATKDVYSGPEPWESRDLGLVK